MNASQESTRPLISPAVCTAATVEVGNIRVDGSRVYWSERRPQNQGRTTIVCWDNEARDTTGPAIDVCSRVHSYGGAPYAIKNSTLVYVTYSDSVQQVVWRDPDGTERTITQSKDEMIGDLVIHPDGKQAFGVCENIHTRIHTLIQISGQGSSITHLVSGHDFFAAPRISPDGTQLCWISWDHPNMPWNGTTLWVAPLHDLTKKQRVCGGWAESIIEPSWGPDGSLYFMSDETGWWNLYRWKEKGISCVFPTDHDCATPPWKLGNAHYAVFDEGIVLTMRTQCGWELRCIHANTPRVSECRTPSFSVIDQLAAHPTGLVACMSDPSQNPRVCILGPDSVDPVELSRTTSIDPAWISKPSVLCIEQHRYPVWGYFYAPLAGDSSVEAPALIVKTHGGPTSATSTTLSMDVQFWTSRGFAVLDVDYGGSSGYGRAYRERLRDRWGIVDVQDVIDLTQYVVSKGWVDRKRVIMTGGSSSGFTTLRVLQSCNLFAGGISCYGISDLTTLSDDTHKFESYYLDQLVPERERAERSPINHIEALRVPMLFFQGACDTAVPPRQTTQFVEALKGRGIHVEYVEYENEGHGFHDVKNLIHMYEHQFAFAQRILSL